MGQTRYWCPTCGCVRSFSSGPLTDCRHNVVADSTGSPPPRAFELLPSWHPLAGAA